MGWAAGLLLKIPGSQKHRGTPNAVPPPFGTAQAQECVEGPHTEKQVVGLGGKAAVLEQPQQIVVLPVDVPADLDQKQATAGDKNVTSP